MSSRSEAAAGDQVRSLLRRVAPRLLLLLLSTVLTLLASEGAMRWLAPQQLILLRPDVWGPDQSGLGWTMAAGLDTRINTGEREVRLITDEHGHRIGERRARAADLEVLALGDSFLAALQVEYEQTATAILELQLSGELGRRVRIVNSGAGGWSPEHYLLKARSELERASYDLVVVFLFRGNDVVAQRRDRFDPRLPAQRAVLSWPRSPTFHELRRAWLEPINDHLETRSHLFVWARHRTWPLLMRLGLSARRFPEAELRSEARRPRWRITGELCSEIAAESAARGVETLFVLLPGAYHVDPEIGLTYARSIGLEPDEVDLDQSSRLLSAELEERELRWVDLTAPLKQLESAGAKIHGEVDTHLSPAGHEAVATELRKPLLRLLEPRAISVRSRPESGG